MQKKILAILIGTTIALTGCNGGDGPQGEQGIPGNPEVEFNEAPKTIPSLKNWVGKTGKTTLTSTSRIVINADEADVLKHLNGMASILNADLKALNGLTLEIVENGGGGKAGDIIFNITGFEPPKHNPSAHDESYTIDIDKKIVINAPEMRGAAYASSTIKQMLVLDFEGNDSLDKGLIMDEPEVRVRGMMLDIGRRTASKEFIKEYMEMLSYYKFSELQLHFNDNQIIWGNGIEGNPGKGNWSWDTWQEDLYVGFSIVLENTEEFPDLSKIGTFNKKNPEMPIYNLTIQDLKDLRSYADSLGLELTAEIDAPAHAAAFTRVYPDLIAQGMNPTKLDIGNPKTLSLLKNIWTQIEDIFHNVHVGADEYNGMPISQCTPEQESNENDSCHSWTPEIGANQDRISSEMIIYMNEMNKFLKETGHQEVRVWGALGTLIDGYKDKVSRDLVQQVWAGNYADTEFAYKNGYKLINLNDAYYTVPTGNAGYPDLVNPENMYKNWDLLTFSGGFKIQNVDDPQFLGAFIANWNDLGYRDYYKYTDGELHARLANVVKIAAQKMWNNKTVLPYDEFQSLAYTLGSSPTFTLSSDVVVEGNVAHGKSGFTDGYQVITDYLHTKPSHVDMLIGHNFIGHPGAAMDGDVDSRWIASEKAMPNSFLSIDLQTTQEITGVEILWGRGWAAEYQIEVSVDGFNWIVVSEVNGSGSEELVRFEPIKARYVKMQGVAMGSDQPYEITEMRVFNK